MRNLYQSVDFLDKKCYQKLALTEDLLMENAAIALREFIKQHFVFGSSVLIVAGGGNNGADGIALSRMLCGSYDVRLYQSMPAKSKMAQLQLKRAQLLGVNLVDEISKADVVVDAILGSGFSGELDDKTQVIIQALNALKTYRIACDIPTGIDQQGNVESIAFKANTTITMGAEKLSLYGDIAKDYIGDVVVADLGISVKKYQSKSYYQILEKSDLKLPFRKKQNTNKGTFGHLAIVSGDKFGASVLAAKAALRFGSGLTSIIGENIFDIKLPELMYVGKIPENTTAIVMGMGLGEGNKNLLKTIVKCDVSMVLDADMFYKKRIIDFVKKDNLILTPHPKEFVALLKLLDIADISVVKLQARRFFYTQQFSAKYPNVVLVLKGANTIISLADELYVNAFGSNALSKGGSGDVLAGLIGALLAQQYTPLESAIHGVLAHSLSAGFYKGHNYSLNPKDIIANLGRLV